MGYKVRLFNNLGEISHISRDNKRKREAYFVKIYGEVSVVIEQENEYAFVCSRDAT